MIETIRTPHTTKLVPNSHRNRHELKNVSRFDAQRQSICIFSVGPSATSQK